MKLKFVGFLAVIITSGLIGLYFATKTMPIKSIPDEISSSNEIKPTITLPYTASFSIFTNGLKRDFTATRYHNQSSDVYLTAQNPSVVTIAKEKITWDDFFKTLPMKLTKQCLTTGTGQVFCTNQTDVLKFFLNGQRNDDILDQVIQPDDHLVVSYGGKNDPAIDEQLQQ